TQLQPTLQERVLPAEARHQAHHGRCESCAPSGLALELDAAQRALTAEHRAVLAKCGVSHIMMEFGFIGFASIELDRAGHRYQPVEQGASAFGTPVRVGEDPTSPESVNFEIVPWLGETIDLVAWHPQYPNRWATRRGIATWVGSIEPQIMMPPS